jgi:hypothetical protein
MNRSSGYLHVDCFPGDVFLVTSGFFLRGAHQVTNESIAPLFDSQGCHATANDVPCWC